MDPSISQKAPEFIVSDSRGLSVSIEDYRGEKSLVLVFNRGFM
jgi:hypothetical protein